MLERRTDQIEMKKRVSRAWEVGREARPSAKRVEETEVQVQPNCRLDTTPHGNSKNLPEQPSIIRNQVLGGSDLMKPGLKAVNYVFFYKCKYFVPW